MSIFLFIFLCFHGFNIAWVVNRYIHYIIKNLPNIIIIIIKKHKFKKQKLKNKSIIKWCSYFIDNIFRLEIYYGSTCLLINGSYCYFAISIHKKDLDNNYTIGKEYEFCIKLIDINTVLPLIWWEDDLDLLITNWLIALLFWSTLKN